ncbi:L,D-transpeptidase [Methylobacterium sp. ID0610]|uniref:L,D-transpeptidase n=1 Tax=Methylobacterium carpenticola TaxID=3344827 RepID=UPI0036883BB4
MTDPTRRILVARAATGLASALLSTALAGAAHAWPLPRNPAPEPEPDGDWPFGGRRSVEPEPDPFWGGPRRPAAPPQEPSVAVDDGPIDYARAYAAVNSEPFPIPAFRWQRANPAFLRQDVGYGGRYEPGTVVIDPRAHHLYLVQPGGRARRYGVGVGRQGFAWSGIATINSKQAWPDWYPPKEMIARQPALARQVSQLQSGLGVPGGPRNPLGARAMYLWQNNKDTLYRIHGTTEPESIGRSVSSGCIRMINQDVMDLYARVSVGAQVVVIG